MKKISLLETESGHWYRIEDAETGSYIYLPSSTNILDCYPNKQLDIWLTGTSPEEIKKAQEEGKIQGSKMHHCIDLMISGDQVFLSGLTDGQIGKLGLTDKKLITYLKQELTRREESALVGFQNFWNDYQPITVSNELLVYKIWWVHKKTHKLIPNKRYIKLKKEDQEHYEIEGFAGTLDWIGYLLNPKTKKYELWILDWKISKQLSRENDLQVSSYHDALQFTYNRSIEAKLGVVQLGNKNKCKYTLKEVKDPEVALDKFYKTKDLWNDQNSKEPPIIVRQSEFAVDTSFTKGKGKTLKLN